MLYFTSQEKMSKNNYEEFPKHVKFKSDKKMGSMQDKKESIPYSNIYLALKERL